MNKKGVLMLILMGVLVLLPLLGFGIKSYLHTRAEHIAALTIELASNGKIDILDIRDSGDEYRIWLGWTDRGGEGTLAATEVTRIDATFRKIITDAKPELVFYIWARPGTDGLYVYAITVCDANEIIQNNTPANCESAQRWAKLEKKHQRWYDKGKPNFYR